jgi:glucan phosphorylase
MQTDKQLIAFFSMEIALDPAMPTYSGGLGLQQAGVAPASSRSSTLHSDGNEGH